MTRDDDIFHGFVFEGKRYPREQVEQATRAVQRALIGTERRRVNDALLTRLAQAKEDHGAASKKELLRDPEISTLVNTLVLVNEAWLKTVLDRNIKRQPHLRRSSAEELYSTALVGRDALGDSVTGMVNAILEYDYDTYGAAAFTRYLDRAISNSLQQTPKERKTYQRVYAGIQPLHGRGEDGARREWVERRAPAPEAATINQDLLEVVRSVIPHLPSQQQRFTAAWMIEHILATGERPSVEEVAQAQQPPVSKQRASQILAETVNSIRYRIEAEYPQLAGQGVNGWAEFKKVLTRASPNADRDGPGNGRA